MSLKAPPAFWSSVNAAPVGATSHCWDPCTSPGSHSWASLSSVAVLGCMAPGKLKWFWVIEKNLAYRNSDQNAGEQGLPIFLSTHPSHENNGVPQCLPPILVHVKSSLTALCGGVDR